MEEGDVFKLTIRYEKEGTYAHRSETANVKHEDEILMLIQENPKITMSEIAQFLAVTKRTVERIMSKLVEEKRIEREGSKKNGQWIVLKMSV